MIAVGPHGVVVDPPGEPVAPLVGETWPPASGGAPIWTGTVAATGPSHGVVMATVDVDPPPAGTDPGSGARSSGRDTGTPVRVAVVVGATPVGVGDRVALRLDRAGCAVVDDPSRVDPRP